MGFNPKLFFFPALLKKKPETLTAFIKDVEWATGKLVCNITYSCIKLKSLKLPRFQKYSVD